MSKELEQELGVGVSKEIVIPPEEAQKLQVAMGNLQKFVDNPEVKKLAAGTEIPKVEMPKIELPPLQGLQQPGPDSEFPEKINLEEYEVLLINATLWREQSANKSVMLAQTELERVTEMRQNLLQRCKIKYGIPDGYHYTIDPVEKTLKIKNKTD